MSFPVNILWQLYKVMSCINKMFSTKCASSTISYPFILRECWKSFFFFQQNVVYLKFSFKSFYIKWTLKIVMSSNLLWQQYKVLFCVSKRLKIILFLNKMCQSYHFMPFCIMRILQNCHSRELCSCYSQMQLLTNNHFFSSA